MEDIAFSNEQVKYFTRIREFKYERPDPSRATPNIQPQTMISLPLPTNLPGDAYQAIVREFNLAEIGSSLEVVRNGFSSASIAEQFGVFATGGIAASAIYAAISGSKSVGDMMGASALLQPILGYGGAYGGYSRNPRTAMIFENMGMRHFNLNFVISPRDEQQSRSLETALTLLRNQMHPELYNQFVLRYPSMFTVEFVNLNYIGVPKIDFSFLKGLTINASPQGQVFYKDGRPSIYEINMEFVEIDMRTRNYFTGAAVGQSVTPVSPGAREPG